MKVDVDIVIDDDMNGINIVEPKPTDYININVDITFRCDNSKFPHPHIVIHMLGQIQP